MNHGGRMSPPRKMRRREPKLQRLPKKASARPHQPEEAPGHLLAAMAGQVDRSRHRAAGEVVAALEEEDRAACVQTCQISFPLATEAGWKRRRRQGRHSKLSAGTAHTRRRRTLAASRSLRRLASTATPLATKAGRRAEREDRGSGS
jgi:hypothetical protein